MSNHRARLSKATTAIPDDLQNLQEEPPVETDSKLPPILAESEENEASKLEEGKARESYTSVDTQGDKKRAARPSSLKAARHRRENENMESTRREAPEAKIRASVGSVSSSEDLEPPKPSSSSRIRNRRSLDKGEEQLYEDSDELERAPPKPSSSRSRLRPRHSMDKGEEQLFVEDPPTKGGVLVSAPPVAAAAVGSNGDDEAEGIKGPPPLERPSATPGAFALRPAGGVARASPTPGVGVAMAPPTREESMGESSTALKSLPNGGPADSFASNPDARGGEYLVAAHVVTDEEDIEKRLRAEFEERLAKQQEQQHAALPVVQAAEVVEVEPIKTDSKDEDDESPKRWIWMVVAAVVVIAVIVGAIVGANAGGDASEGTSAPTIAPSPAPTEEPTLLEQLIDLFTPVSGEEPFLNVESPQHQAVSYLVDNSDLLLADEPPERQLVERYIVSLFYFAANGDGWDNSYNFFNSTNHCDWYDSRRGVGITCSTKDVVTAIRTFGNRMQGSLIPELGHLSDLESLLIYNETGLNGTIPSQIARLDELRYLQLSNTALWGTIPPEVADMPELQYLNLNDNQLSGEIPIWNQRSELYHFSLSNNRGLHGNLVHLFESLPNFLSEISCAYCDFSGSRLDDLDWSDVYVNSLDLENTFLTGTIPDSIMGSLYSLRLGHNALSGTFPTSIQQYINEIDLSYNLLTGTIPSDTLNFTSFFDVSGNALEGNLTAILNSLSPQFLRDFGVGDNNIVGQIPSDIGQYLGMEAFNIANNSISGTLPNSLGQMDGIQLFDVSGNDLVGTIPDSLATLPYLSYLLLHNNSFEDDIDDVFCTNTTSYELVAADCINPVSVQCDCCLCYSVADQRFYE